MTHPVTNSSETRTCSQSQNQKLVAMLGFEAGCTDLQSTWWTPGGTPELDCGVLCFTHLSRAGRGALQGESGAG